MKFYHPFRPELKREVDEKEILENCPMERKTCSCGAMEGQYHKDFCEHEVCPLCGGFLRDCDCFWDFCYEQYGEYPEDDKSCDKANDEFMKVLDRIPYIEYPHICPKCGWVWPQNFMVPDEDWKTYIQPDKRHSKMCPVCFAHIRHWMDMEGNSIKLTYRNEVKESTAKKKYQRAIKAIETNVLTKNNKKSDTYNLEKTHGGKVK